MVVPYAGCERSTRAPHPTWVRCSVPDSSGSAGSRFQRFLHQRADLTRPVPEKTLLPLVALLLWIAAMVCARWHMLEKGVPGVGFGALTTLAILFGQSLTPSHDIIFATLYRLSSVCVSVLLTLFVVFMVHRLLNRFVTTRHSSH